MCYAKGIATVLFVAALWGGVFSKVNAQLVQERYGTIRVVGEATASAAPDKATIRFGIVTLNQDPEEARRLNAEASRRAMNAVRQLIEDERHLRLEGLRLQPAREYDPERRQYVDLGFEAIRDVVVDVQDLDVLPTLVARIVQEGANRLHGVTYELRDQDEVQHLALGRAIDNAYAKAEVMARALDVVVGRVLNVSEQDGGRPIPIMRDTMMEYAAARAAEPEPEAYAPGEIEVRKTVEVVFAIRRADGE